MTDELIYFQHAEVARPGGLVFRELSWTLRDGETWAITGPTAAGKTSFAQVLRGRWPVVAGESRWPIVTRAGAKLASDVVKLVAFREQSRLFAHNAHYHQERFNFTDPLDDRTLASYLVAELPISTSEATAMATRFGLAGRLGHSMVRLSNGEGRRARIARALLTRPQLLILDDPFLGVDAAGRTELAHFLAQEVTHGSRLLLIVRPEDVPEWITHVLQLEAMTIRWQGRKADWLRPSPPAMKKLPPAVATGTGEVLAELHDVTVRYDETTVLDRVSWTIRRGERWALSGANGAGKSTLLALIVGDHPQAYANPVRLFGRQRGTGESIWELKQRIGHLSPEMHLYFREPLTARQTAATGFWDSMTPRRLSAEQRNRLDQLFAEFTLADVADIPFARLSTGQQRLVFILRAVVKNPDLLVLDEPFQGLDTAAVNAAKHWLETHLRPEQSLIFVTHRPEEWPANITHHLHLDRGRIEVL